MTEEIVKLEPETAVKANPKLDRILEDLSHGQKLEKVKSGGKLFQRMFYMDPDRMVLWYTGSKKSCMGKTRWQLAKVREVRDGEEDYSKRLKYCDKGRCFTIVIGSHNKPIYLMANNWTTKDKWVRGLRYALKMNKGFQRKDRRDCWIRQAFDLADKDKHGTLDLEEVMKLLKKLNADMDRKVVKRLFQEADEDIKRKGKKSTLNREEFVTFYQMLTKRPEMQEIFDKYTHGDDSGMTVEELKTFLNTEQKQSSVTAEMCREYLTKYEPDEELVEAGELSIAGFRNFMASKTQQIFNPAHREVYQDMTQPMTNYFINSSHNTYLAEDQLKGPSKVECYITALRRGCRCVELDCWDGPDNEPVIYHGYTLTSKILFKDVIAAVQNYAFTASQYPVTLSIENHCSIDQQKVMAEHVKSILGDVLYTPKLIPDVSPSPEELKGKILLKGKKLPPSMTSDLDEEVSDEDEAADVLTGEEEKDDDEEDEDESNENDDNKDENEKNKDGKVEKKEKDKAKLSQEFSDCVGMKSQKMRGTKTAIESGTGFCIYSLAEGKIGKLLKKNPAAINRLSRQKLLRIYPGGTRTDSSNYDPVPSWNSGCQVVALNFQTGSEPMELLSGRFLDNGGSGYILKPTCLLTDEGYKVVTGETKSPTAKEIKITIISGYQIPKPKDSKKGEVIDPFVKIEIHGVSQDNQEQQTKTIHNNGFTPRWDETFSFVVNVPELALARIAVYDQDKIANDFIGYYTLPCNSIQQGYRQIPLLNRYGTRYPRALLLVHVEIGSG